MSRAFVSALALACALLLPLESGLAAPPRGHGEPREPRAGMFGGPNRPLFLEQLFRPELVMRHQAEIGITAEQRAEIAAAIRETQERLAPLHWEVEAKSEAVAKLLEGERVDVEPALDRLGEVIDVEGRIKKEHVRLLLRIKNVLTAEQQRKLRELRPDRCGAERR